MRDSQRAQATSYCAACPKLCRSECPVGEAAKTEETTTWGKMSLMDKVAKKTILQTAENMAPAYLCLGCGGTQERCELNNPVPDTLMSYRRDAFHAGVSPKGVYEYVDRFEKYQNPFEKSLYAILQSHFPQHLKKSSLTFFPGCDEIMYAPERIEKTFHLAHSLGVSTMGLYNDPIQCCGYPLYAAGDWEGFMALAQSQSRSLNRHKVIVSGSSKCLYTIEKLYAEAGFKIRAETYHISEFLWHKTALSKRNMPVPKKKSRVIYHDPCFLARQRGERAVHEEPRAMIRQATGKAPLEFLRNREKTYCCGGGGILSVTHPELTEQITQDRIDQIPSGESADALITACTTCVQRFQSSGKVQIPVYELRDFLYDQWLK